MDEDEAEVQDARYDINGNAHSSLDERITVSEAEVREARNGFDSLNQRESSQDNDIKNANTRINRVNSIAQSASNGSPRGTFPTATDLKNKYPKGTSGIFVTTNSGHWWYYSGSWQDGGVYQGKEVEDKSITSAKLDNELKINGFNYGGGQTTLQWHTGYVASKLKEDFDGTKEGTIVNDDEFSVTQPIMVQKNDVVQIRAQAGGRVSMVSMWTPNGDYERSLADGMDDDIQIVLTIPRVGFIRISNWTKKYPNGNASMYKYPYFYEKSMSNELIGSVEWENLRVNWETRTYAGTSRNPTSPNQLVQGHGSSTNNRLSEAFFVPADTIVSTNAANSENSCVIAEFSEDGKTYIRELVPGSGKNSRSSYRAEKDMFIRVGNNYGMEENVVISTAKGKNSANSNLNGKVMNIIGDSYVANNGNPVSDTWHYKLAQKNSMTYNNYGINGNGLVTPNRNREPVVARYGQMAEGADYIVVVGGRNDYNDQYPLADFRKGIDKLIEGIVTKYTSSKLCFFTPWSVNDDVNQKLKVKDYADIMEEECQKYGIPCFNSNRKSGMSMWNRVFRKKYSMKETDPSHLNANGHDRFMPRAEAFLNSL